MSEKQAPLKAVRTQVLTCVGILGYPDVVTPAAPKDWGDDDGKVKDPQFKARLYVGKDAYDGSDFEKSLVPAAKHVAAEKFGKGVKFKHAYKTDGDDLNDDAATGNWSFTANYKPKFGNPRLYTSAGQEVCVEGSSRAEVEGVVVMAESALQQMFSHGAYAELVVKPYPYDYRGKGVALSLLAVKLTEVDGESFADVKRSQEEIEDEILARWTEEQKSNPNSFENQAKEIEDEEVAW